MATAGCLSPRFDNGLDPGGPGALLFLLGGSRSISDLAARYPTGTIIRLRWTSIGGTGYDVRYSTSPIASDESCTAATPYSQSMVPASAGYKKPCP